MAADNNKISNMVTRIVSGIVFALVMIGLVWAGGIVCALGFYFISRIAFHELLDVFRLRNSKDPKLSFYQLVGDGLLTVHYLWIVLGLPHFYALFSAVGGFMFILFLSIVDYPKHDHDDVMRLIVSFVYGGLMLSFVPLCRSLAAADESGMYIYGFFMAWMILIPAWASDTFAYFVGVAIGKHKAFPKLSPKKSWEGCIGGLVGAAAAGLLYGFVLKWTGYGEYGSPKMFMIIGFAGSIIGQIGDLVASGIKRRYGIKDFGKLIPGHGGIMDRFDSVAFIAPTIYFFAYSILNDPILWK